MMNTNKTTLAVMIASCFGTGLTMAQETQDAGKVLSPVVVTATRVEQDSFDLPMSIDKVEKKDIQDGQLRMTLSESLIRVPGITAQSRSQMAQDPQISSRGFGARSSFGVRGLRIFVDGIPLSMPDGIGNPGSIDLGTIGSIEVLRGPFSTMYGSSSGGVIQMFTEKASDRPTAEADVLYGSFGTTRAGVKASGTQSNYEYSLSYSDYQSDGFREQSANSKKQATVSLKSKIDDDTRLTTLINWMNQNAQDPGGLVRVAATGDPSAFVTPTGTASNNKLINARVERSNSQVGLNFEKTINAQNSLNLIAYAGTRDNNQILYTTVPGQTYNSRASVIERVFYGTELRFTTKGEVLDKPYIVTAGVTYGQMRDKRKDINADNGVSRADVDANHNRNERQSATSFDQYLQGTLAANSRFDVHAGVRYTTVDLKFEDLQIDASRCGALPRYCDTSGKVNYSKFTPALGATYKLTPAVNLYANYGRAFETPTLVETSFLDASTGSGPNLNIKPSTSDNFELGAKAFVGDNTRINGALFKIDTTNEIIVNTSQSGRTSYQNGKTTSRTGAELSVESILSHGFSVYGAYTLLVAKFDEAFSSSGNAVAAGSYIPGTYRTQVYGEVAWKHAPTAFQTAIETRYNSRVYVNDSNSDFAPSYTIVNLRGSFQQELGRWRLTEYARVENIFDKSFIGSVRVNDYTNKRYFEPAPGRNWIVGIKANYAF